MPRPAHSRRAFTLIELMIVVAIFAIISAILIPSFIRTIENSRQRQAVAQTAAAVEPLPDGLPARLEKAQVDLTVEVEPRRVGLDLANTYYLEHRGRYRFKLDGKTAPRLLVFPLPEGLVDVEGLSFQVLDGQTWREPQDLVYRRDLLAWQTPPGAFPVEVRLDYRGAGQDRLNFNWPLAARIDSLEADVRLIGAAQTVVPLGSLRPSSEQDSNYSYQAQDLLSPAPLVLEFSAPDAPLARVGKLFRLTGLALLLFGAGFWYLAELYRPGSLKNFGFGSFFLLALTYCSFFVAVAVLGFDGRLSPAQYLGLALLLSQPLLLFHVAQFSGLRFALTRAVPLSLATLAVVLVGVYGSDWKHHAFLGMGLLCMAFLTTSYGPFLKARQQRQEQQRQRNEAAAQQLEAIQKRASGTRSSLLLELADRHTAAAQRLVPALEECLSDLQDYSVYGDSEENYLYGCRRLTEKIEKAEALLEQLRLLQERGQRNQAELGLLHCLFCGHPDAGGPFCSGCGTVMPVRQNCLGCQTAVIVPKHLLSSQQLYHCHACGSCT